MSSASSPSIRQIALAAGVSKSTAAYALQNHPSISAETRARVQETAAQFGYHHNPVISNVMSRIRGQKKADLGTIAYIDSLSAVRSPSAAFLENQLFEGSSQIAAQSGFCMERFSVCEPGITASRLNQIFKSRGIAGVIVSRLSIHPGHLRLDWDRFASVSIGFSLVRPNLHRVSFDHNAGFALALRNCRRAGCRRLGFVVPKETSKRTNNVWLSQFLVHQHLAPREDRVPPLIVDSLDEKGSAQFAKWFKKNRPEAIISLNTIHRWLKEMEIGVPEEVSFVSMDWSERHASLTGVDQSRKIMGSVAAEVVMRGIMQHETGVPRNPHLIMVDGIWRRGESLRAGSFKKSPAQ